MSNDATVERQERLRKTMRDQTSTNLNSSWKNSVQDTSSRRDATSKKDQEAPSPWPSKPKVPVPIETL